MAKESGRDESIWYRLGMRVAPYLLIPPYLLWCSTLKISFVNRHLEDELKEGVVGAFWHNRLFPMVYLYRKYRPIIMVSRSRDGEFISRVIEKVGMGTVRGSSTRGGREALMEMIKMASCHRPLVVIPDGPKGPKYQAKPGAVLAAQKTGLPLLPFSVGYSKAKVLGSWDGFLVPHPFSRMVVVYGNPRRISPDAKIDEEREWLQEELTRVTQEAERLALE